MLLFEHTASCKNTCDHLQSWEWLVEYTKLDSQGKGQELRASKAQRDILRVALERVVAEPNAEAGWAPQSPEVLLGIMSSDVRLGIRALRDWTERFRAEYIVPEVRVWLMECCDATADTRCLVYIATSWSW